MIFKKDRVKISEINLIIYNMIIILITLSQTILITKFLSQKDYGIYGFYISLSQYIFVLANWGFSSWGVNKISKNIHYKAEIFKNIIYSRLVSGAVAFILVSFYFYFFLKSYSFIVYFGYLLYYLSIVFSTEILYISDNKIKDFIIINFKAKIFYTFFLITFIFLFNANASVLFFLFAIQNIAISIYTFYTYKSIINSNYVFKIKNILSTLKYSFSNSLLVFMSFLFASGPVILSGMLMNKDKFSVVYASVAIIKMIQATYNPMIQKILPKLNHAHSDENKIVLIKSDVLISISYAILTTILIWIFAPLIVRVVFSYKYIGLVQAIRIYSISILPGLLNTLIISQLFVYYDMIKHSYLIVIFSSILVYLLLIYNLNELSWSRVIISMIIGEFFQLSLLCFIFFIKNKMAIKKVSFLTF